MVENWVYKKVDLKAVQLVLSLVALMELKTEKL